MAGDNFQVLRSSCNPARGSIDLKTVAGVVCDRRLVIAVDGAIGGCDQAKPVLLSCLLSSKRGARGDGDVVDSGAGCCGDYRQPAVVVAGLFSLGQKDSSGGWQ